MIVDLELFYTDLAVDFLKIAFKKNANYFF